MMSAIKGEADPIETAINIRHQRQAAAHRSKQQRNLMNVDEVLYTAELERPEKLRQKREETRRERRRWFGPLF